MKAKSLATTYSLFKGILYSKMSFELSSVRTTLRIFTKGRVECGIFFDRTEQVK